MMGITNMKRPVTIKIYVVRSEGVDNQNHNTRKVSFIQSKKQRGTKHGVPKLVKRIPGECELLGSVVHYLH